jgi:hypothetical protein
MKKLKPSFLVLALLVTGMLSVRISSGQTMQRTVATATVGPTLTSAPQPVTVSPWSWSGFNQPQIQQQQAPYRTYWTNPNPNRIFPPLTKESMATFWRTF